MNKILHKSPEIYVGVALGPTRKDDRNSERVRIHSFTTFTTSSNKNYNFILPKHPTESFKKNTVVVSVVIVK